MNHIRPIAIGVFLHQEAILVFEGYDRVKEQFFYRPAGGGIEFGEPSQVALIREIREELSAEIENVHYLATLENIFDNDGIPGHEFVVVYQAKFSDPTFYQRSRFTGYEDDGTPFELLWKPLRDFQNGSPPLYPDGLMDLLAGVSP